MNIDLLKQQISTISAGENALRTLVDLLPYLPEIIRLAAIGQAVESLIERPNENVSCDVEVSQAVAPDVQSTEVRANPAHPYLSAMRTSMAINKAAAVAPEFCPSIDASEQCCCQKADA